MASVSQNGRKFTTFPNTCNHFLISHSCTNFFPCQCLYPSPPPMATIIRLVILPETPENALSCETCQACQVNANRQHSFNVHRPIITAKYSKSNRLWKHNSVAGGVEYGYEDSGWQTALPIHAHKDTTQSVPKTQLPSIRGTQIVGPGANSPLRGGPYGRVCSGKRMLLFWASRLGFSPDKPRRPGVGNFPKMAFR